MSEGFPSLVGSRRRLLATAGAGMAALAGCGGPHHPKVTTAGAVSTQDMERVVGLLHLERRTVAAYEAGIPLLGAAAAKDAEQFLHHELSHAGELSGLLKKAGTTAPPPTAGYDLGHPRTGAEVLELLHSLEAAQLAAYLHAIPLLSGGEVRAALAAVFANDAQHVAVLRTHLHRAPSPAAFVTGRE